MPIEYLTHTNVTNLLWANIVFLNEERKLLKRHESLTPHITFAMRNSFFYFVRNVRSRKATVFQCGNTHRRLRDPKCYFKCAGIAIWTVGISICKCAYDSAYVFEQRHMSCVGRHLRVEAVDVPVVAVAWDTGTPRPRRPRATLGLLTRSPIQVTCYSERRPEQEPV